MFLFILYSRAAASLSLSGNRNLISAVSSKGGKSRSQSYHKAGVSVFNSYKSEQVKTPGSCAILCLKEGVARCNSFHVKDEEGGKLECTLGVSPGLPGNIEIYTTPLEDRPSTTTTTTTTTNTTTTTSLSVASCKPGTCTGSCGTFDMVSQCKCDTICEYTGGCCCDKTTVCSFDSLIGSWVENLAPSSTTSSSVASCKPGSCTGYCGNLATLSESQCWCDDICDGSGDCCCDRDTQCSLDCSGKWVEKPSKLILT